MALVGWRNRRSCIRELSCSAARATSMAGLGLAAIDGTVSFRRAQQVLSKARDCRGEIGIVGTALDDRVFLNECLILSIQIEPSLDRDRAMDTERSPPPALTAQTLRLRLEPRLSCAISGGDACLGPILADIAQTTRNRRERLHSTRVARSHRTTSASRNRLPARIALRYVGVVACGIGAVVPSRRGVGLAIAIIAIVWGVIPAIGISIVTEP
jgi:hypothetical protein